MNKRIALMLLVAASSASHKMLAMSQCFNPEGNLEVKALSKSFFSVRPPFQLNSPEFLAGWWYDRLDAKGKECRNGTLQLVGLGGKSTDAYNLARYFTFNNSSVLHIVEQSGIPATDILSEQVDIYSVDGTFESFLALKPRYSFGGLGISYRQEFAQRSDGRAFWFLASAPIINIKTGMHLEETIINDGGGVNPAVPGAVPNAVEAFSQTAFDFGKILCENKTKTGLGDLTLLLGYKTIAHEDYSMNGYIGMIAPTGSRVKSKEMFEAVVGNNHHFGALLGSSASVSLWECENGSCLDFEFSAHGQFLFKRHEVRSFDLKNKPWSRYMQMYANVAAAEAAFAADDLYSNTTPGINILTQPVQVYPGFSSTSNTAVVFTSCDGNKQFELGYNFYARQSEYVELACPWQVGPALKSLLGLGGATDSVQQIGNNYGGNNVVNPDGAPAVFSVADYNSTQIQVTDLDLLSATHPAIISNTVYANVTYRCDAHEYPRFIALGGSYEFEEDNTTLNRWTIWLKGGISF